jgi:hypothetical protein
VLLTLTLAENRRSLAVVVDITTVVVVVEVIKMEVSASCKKKR